MNTAEFDKATKENKKARFLKSGSAGVVKFEVTPCTMKREANS